MLVLVLVLLLLLLLLRLLMSLLLLLCMLLLSLLLPHLRFAHVLPDWRLVTPALIGAGRIAPLLGHVARIWPARSWGVGVPLVRSRASLRRDWFGRRSPG